MMINKQLDMMDINIRSMTNDNKAIHNLMQKMASHQGIEDEEAMDEMMDEASIKWCHQEISGSRSTDMD